MRKPRACMHWLNDDGIWVLSSSYANMSQNESLTAISFQQHLYDFIYANQKRGTMRALCESLVLFDKVFIV